jgi:hypothetical protein
VRWSVGPLALVALVLALPASALGHAERDAYFPDHRLGKVPKYRTSGPALVVCKADSGKRIRALGGGGKRARAARGRNLTLLRACEHRHIQAAVDAARNGTRILVLPGVYQEEPSRRVPKEPDTCAGDRYGAEGSDARPYEFHRDCPNAQNLIAIVGDDDDEDRRCDDKCNIQIEGTGLKPSDVRIVGGGYGDKPGAKLNVIRADRADGIVLRNFLVQYSDFNNVYVLETNGFRLDRIVSRWSREYGFLTFTSDNGLYHRVRAYGSGDSGIYPGSGPEGHCQRYGIEVRYSESYGNTIGWSGTAGNGVYTHHSRFHHNSAGITMDSFSGGHPGMPQDCSKWESNRIYSNNADLFNDKRDRYCENTAPERRDPRKVCPTFQVPVGTGVLTGGGNGNIFRNNWIYDNWRRGTMLFWVPGALRGEDPTGQSAPNEDYETSHQNKYVGNRMGFRPDGRRDPNGVDFWWDEEGRGNCWSANKGPDGGVFTSDPQPRLLLACPKGSSFSIGNTEKQASLFTCAAWDPIENPDPVGCDWFKRPREPR